jgi:Uma2 family endonuclease
LGLLIHILADELHVPIKGGGSATFRREDLDRGIEPDQCFYTKNEPAIRGKRTIDLATDPPPDLAVEVEISRRLLDRVGIYAALGIPELWRYDGEHLRVFTLGPNAEYHPCDRSPTFPAVPLEMIEKFVADSRTAEETEWARGIREWVRKPG